MKAEDFYSADDRRRDSAEVEFGRRWVDERGRGPYQVNVIVDTGEVFALFFGAGPVSDGADLGGDIADMFIGAAIGGLVAHTTDAPEQLVELGSVAPSADVETVLDGWRAQERQRTGFAWLRGRLTPPD